MDLLVALNIQIKTAPGQMYIRCCIDPSPPNKFIKPPDHLVSRGWTIFFSLRVGGVLAYVVLEEKKTIFTLGKD